MGRRVRLTVDLQDDFALNQPLSLFVLDAVPRLDSMLARVGPRRRFRGRVHPGRPPAGADGQLERLRTETLARLKEEGMEYEERMEVLRELEHPKPLADFLYEVFDDYRARHPWARDHNVHPKSIVRDMYERSMSFAEYVAHYGLTRSEGCLLRYLSDAYKALVQNVPEDLKSHDSARPLRMARGNGPPGRLEPARRMGTAEPPRGVRGRPGPRGAARRRRRSREQSRRRSPPTCGRSGSWSATPASGESNWRPNATGPPSAKWTRTRAGTPPRWEAAFAPYFADHASIGTGPAARGRYAVAG